MNEIARRLVHSAGAVPRRCGACAHFVDDPAAFEAAIKGLTAMGSGHASVRGRDGICRLRERFCSATWSCAEFTAKAALRLDTEQSATANIV